MARIGRCRNLAFVLVLLGALANTPTSAYEDQCASLGECAWCSSGTPCKTLGSQDACDQWDGTGDDCDPQDPPTFCSGGYVRCDCFFCM